MRACGRDGAVRRSCAACLEQRASGRGAVRGGLGHGARDDSLLVKPAVSPPPPEQELHGATDCELVHKTTQM